MGQLVPGGDGIGDPASLELVVLRVSPLDIMGTQTVGLDVLVAHDVALWNWLHESRV